MNFFRIFETDLDRRLLEIQQSGLNSDLECAKTFLEGALAKTNLILSRKNLREALTLDEEIDIGVKRARIEKMLEEVCNLIADFKNP
jgi:hypothetical protein